MVGLDLDVVNSLTKRLRAQLFGQPFDRRRSLRRHTERPNAVQIRLAPKVSAPEQMSGSVRILGRRLDCLGRYDQCVRRGWRWRAGGRASSKPTHGHDESPQFEHIYRQTKAFHAAEQSVILVDEHRLFSLSGLPRRTASFARDTALHAARYLVTARSCKLRKDALPIFNRSRARIS
jgi:hypothetical protein